MSSFDYSQFVDWTKDVAGIEKNFEEDFLKPFMLKMAERALEEIIPNTPKDTGALRASWVIGNAAVQIGRTKDQEPSALEQGATVESVKVVGDNVEVEIWNGMDYASFVELGTVRNNGEGKLMMAKGINRVQEQIPARYQKEFAEWLSKQGV